MLDFDFDNFESLLNDQDDLGFARDYLDQYVRDITNETSMGYVDFYARARGEVIREEYPDDSDTIYDSKFLGDVTTIGEVDRETLLAIAELAYELHYGTGIDDKLNEILDEARDAELMSTFGLSEDDNDIICAINEWESENVGMFDYEISEYGYTFTSANQINKCANDLGLEVK